MDAIKPICFGEGAMGTIHNIHPEKSIMNNQEKLEYLFDMLRLIRDVAGSCINENKIEVIKDLIDETLDTIK
jgi:hypothetical protein